LRSKSNPRRNPVQRREFNLIQMHNLIVRLRKRSKQAIRMRLRNYLNLNRLRRKFHLPLRVKMRILEKSTLFLVHPRKKHSRFEKLYHLNIYWSPFIILLII
jgi:hypothetical protein